MHVPSKKAGQDASMKHCKKRHCINAYLSILKLLLQVAVQKKRVHAFAIAMVALWAHIPSCPLHSAHMPFNFYCLITITLRLGLHL